MMLRGTQINYMTEKSHAIIIIINTQGQIVQIHLRSGKTGNIFLQLVSQHCCTASWNRCCAYYRVRDQLVSQQNIVLQICGILGVWLVGCKQRWRLLKPFFVGREHLPLSFWAFCLVKARKGLENEVFNLQCNNVARQVEGKCCPFYRTLKSLKRVTSSVFSSSFPHALSLKRSRWLPIFISFLKQVNHYLSAVKV